MTVLKQIKASETLFINELALKLEAEGRTIYRFGFGESPFQPPIEAIQALQENAHHTSYLSVQGLLELREAAAQFYTKHPNLHDTQADVTPISAEDIFIGPGSKILIYAIQASLEDIEVLLPAPSWVSYKPQADICKHSTQYLETKFASRWRISAEQLDQACIANSKRKILILNYPGNPDGLSYSIDELKDIAAVARKHKVLVIADEIYALLSHNASHASIRDYYPEGTVVTTGLSKMWGAGGWRLGVGILPNPDISIYPDLGKTMHGIASELYSSTASPVQYAAIKAFESIESSMQYLGAQRSILQTLGNWCYKQLSEVDINLHPPQGAFYIFPEFSNHHEQLAKRGITTSIELCDALLQEASITSLPGTAFGHDPSLLACRMAYVQFDGNEALCHFEELQRNDEAMTESFIKQHCPKVITGIQKLKEWLKN